jgi:hypothetical protein
MSVVEEHAETQRAIQRASEFPGELGATAQSLLDALEPHMDQEHRFGLAMLELLPAIARGDVTADMAQWLPAADALRAELEALKREHRRIAMLAGEMSRAAWAQQRPQYAETAQRLVRHMRLEEEVLYPASLVAGDYLRARLANAGTDMGTDSRGTP